MVADQAIIPGGQRFAHRATSHGQSCRSGEGITVHNGTVSAVEDFEGVGSRTEVILNQITATGDAGAGPDDDRAEVSGEGDLDQAVIYAATIRCLQILQGKREIGAVNRWDSEVPEGLTRDRD